MSEIQTGTWRIRAVAGSQQFGVSGSGNEQIAVTVMFIEGPNKDRRIPWYGTFTEGTEKRTLESLRFLGWSNDDLFNMEGLGACEAEAVVEEEEGRDGKTRVRVRWINRLRGPSFKDPLEGERLKTFAARMKGRAIATRQELEKNGQMPTPTQRASGGTRDDDEPPPHSDKDFGLD